MTLKSFWFDTPLGSMIAIADEQALYLLEFFDRKNLESEVKKLKAYAKADIYPGITRPIELVKEEIDQYFQGSLQTFRTPIHMIGSQFQKSAWDALMMVPYGETISYRVQAARLGKPSANRAVANANGTNQIAIIIPCHRIIRSDGGLSGYGAGVWRKEWLINHEKGTK